MEIRGIAAYTTPDLTGLTNSRPSKVLHNQIHVTLGFHHITGFRLIGAVSWRGVGHPFTRVSDQQRAGNPRSFARSRGTVGRKGTSVFLTNVFWQLSIAVGSRVVAELPHLYPESSRISHSSHQLCSMCGDMFWPYGSCRSKSDVRM